MIAPAKVNLCLYLGRTRPDGLHELCSLFVPISLADRLSVSDAGGGSDEVLCPGVEAPDLTARALAALRAEGWRRSPLRIEVDKRIPVAAGLGGGSADAAAVLRLADADPFEGEGVLERIAASLGADVTFQLDPRFALVEGAGEKVNPLPEPEPFWLVLVPDPDGLSTAEVYAEADRLGLGRPDQVMQRMRSLLLAACAAGASPLEYGALLANDLAPAAISLRPSIAGSLAALEDAGAALARVTGSGPTAYGLFADAGDAEAAAEALRGGGREAIVTRSGIEV